MESQIIRGILSRRRWLGVAGLGWLSAMGLSRLSTAAPSPITRQPIRSCILVFFYGGPSQLETFDPKPNAPSGVRGEYQTISTAVPGTFVGEHLPKTAAIMNRLALVRSMHHPMRNHNSAAAEVLTGRTPAGGDLELLADEARSYPTLGSSVSYALGARANVLPYVALPYTIYNVVQLPGQTPGILGGRYDRFQVSGNPGNPDFRIAALQPPGERQPQEIAQRNDLLHQLDSFAASQPASRMRTYQQRAFDLVSSDSVRKSFAIEQEEAKTRDRYGRTLVGQSLLLARRLVEGGVNFVTVFDGERNGQEANWDSHEKLFSRHKQLIPPADQGFSALIEDLETRGLLDSTLVVGMGEFGRTPKINGNAGRDHWPDCYTVVLAGGGTIGGAIHGASDRLAAYPSLDPISPADLAATVLWRFGIDPAKEFLDPTGRPIRLADGMPLTKVFRS
jgi:uncharacterized protein DUF1501